MLLSLDLYTKCIVLEILKGMESYYKTKVLKELLQETEYILPAVEGDAICEECWNNIPVATLSIGYRWFCCNDCMIEWEFLRVGC